MRAYYYDNLTGDQRLPHDLSPSRSVSKERLQRLNVKTWTFSVDQYEGPLDAVAKQEGYSDRDTMVVSRDTLGAAYDGKIRFMFDEHLHDEEEARFIISGSGYYDVRETPSEDWIRIAFGPGDLISLPVGIYHRFTPDEANYIEALRLFRGNPKWNRYTRSEETDNGPQHSSYLDSVGH